MVKKIYLMMFYLGISCIAHAGLTDPFEYEYAHEKRNNRTTGPRLCAFNLKEGKHYKVIFDQDDNPIALELHDTSQQEQANSAFRAFGVSIVMGFLAESLGIKNNNKGLTHLIGLFGAVAANTFVGGVVCQDRNLVTQAGGIVTGYLAGAVARNSVK